MSYFLGADLGGTKTHVLISDAEGRALGFGSGGPGNHETVGYEGASTSLRSATTAALHSAGLNADSITAAGFGVAGYDWPNERVPHLNMIASLGLGGKLELVNDVELGLLVGSPRLWGVALVSGTSCNCCGWDETRTHFGRVTGGGALFGENAGGSELMLRVAQVLAHAWTGRGQPTALTEVFCKRLGVPDGAALMQGLVSRELSLNAADAPLIFDAARQGDAVALDLVRWTGRELGEMACTVIHQLHFEALDFDLVQIGSLWEGSPLMTEETAAQVHSIAPGANLLRTHEPPVIGAVLLAMQTANLPVSHEVRQHLIESLRVLRQ